MKLKGPIRQKYDRKNSHKMKSFRRIYGLKYSLKGHKDRNRHKKRIKRVDKLGWFMSDMNCNIPIT